VNGPAQRAEEAAEAIRALNYATLPGAGELMFPAGAYETAGALAVLAGRLPQALAQLSAFLQEQVNAGRVVIVAGEHAGDPAAAISMARCHLDAAASSARQLQQSLDAAQQSLTWAAAASSRLARRHGNETAKTTWPGTRYVSMLTASARGVSVAG
jgi:hypothetical protein